MKRPAKSVNRSDTASLPWPAAVLSFLMGIGFVIAGLRSRHYWMTIWGTGLSLCSAAYLVYYSLLL